jgi:hypothetical protein
MVTVYHNDRICLQRLAYSRVMAGTRVRFRRPEHKACPGHPRL